MNHLLVIATGLVLSGFLNIFSSCESTIFDKVTSRSEVLAKRSLVEKERLYLVEQPMSPELQEFIQTIKRNEKRKKRDGSIMDNTLYVVRDGSLVPYRNIKGIKDNEIRCDEIDKEVNKGFTVVPLVVPLKSNWNERLVRAEKDIGMEASQKIRYRDASDESTSRSTAEHTTATQNDLESVDTNTTEDNVEDTQLLHKILEDVEGLMTWKGDGNKREGSLCSLNGSWISDAAGMNFDMCYKNSTRKKFKIHVSERIPPKDDGFMCDGNWTLFGELPFHHSGMVIVLAVHERDRHIGTFIGECRICEGSETVTGTWLLDRASKDCKDQKASHKILSDVWRKENVHALQKKHLEEIGKTLPPDAT